MSCESGLKESSGRLSVLLLKFSRESRAMLSDRKHNPLTEGLQTRTQVFI